MLCRFTFFRWMEGIGASNCSRVPAPSPCVVQIAILRALFSRRQAIGRVDDEWLTRTLQAGGLPAASRASSDTATRGRPSRRPWRLTRASPARIRSAHLARSNSLMAPRMCIWSFPAGVVASIPSATPSAWRSSSSVIRCLRLRPSRSSRQQTRTSMRRRLASRTSWSRAGRWSRAPLTPSSRYSRASQPRASTNRRSSSSWFSTSWSWTARVQPCSDLDWPSRFWTRTSRRPAATSRQHDAPGQRAGVPGGGRDGV